MKGQFFCTRAYKGRGSRAIKALRKFRFQSAGGFALIAALLALMVINALALLVFTVTTQDIRIASRGLGEKKAFSAAESGVNRLMESFDPDNLSSSLVNNVVVEPSADPQSQFSVTAVGFPTQGPEVLPLTGYSIAGGQTWGQNRYVASVSGANTRYNSSTGIDVSMGFGPIEFMTTYR